jgi:hypothetical protein
MQLQMQCVEPVPIPDTVASELVDIEHLGSGVYRFTFAATKRDIITFVEVYEVRLRVVLPASAVIRAALWALKAVGAQCCGAFIMDRCRLH